MALIERLGVLKNALGIPHNIQPVHQAQDRKPKPMLIGSNKKDHVDEDKKNIDREPRSTI
jgi:hypothetical protein